MERETSDKIKSYVGRTFVGFGFLNLLAIVGLTSNPDGSIMCGVSGYRVAHTDECVSTADVPAKAFLITGGLAVGSTVIGLVVLSTRSEEYYISTERGDDQEIKPPDPPGDASSLADQNDSDNDPLPGIPEPYIPPDSNQFS